MNAVIDTIHSGEVLEAIVRGRVSDPFSVLGMHLIDGRPAITVFAPDAGEIEVLDAKGKPVAKMKRVHPEGVFVAQFPRKRNAFPYSLRCHAGTHVWDKHDPYSFPPVLGETDEYLMAEGRHEELWKRLGSHPMTHDEVECVAFAVCAPGQRRGPFQRLGRTSPPDAQAPRWRAVGIVHSRPSGGRYLQIRSGRRIGRGSAAEGRSAGAADGTRAGHRFDCHRRAGS